MTDTVPAAATGLPAASSFDRRSFLATLAAAGVMTPGMAEAAAPCSAGHPDVELLELVLLLAAADARRRDFGMRSDAAFAERYKAPAYSEAMFWRRSDRFSVWTDPARLRMVVVEGVYRYVYDTQGAAATIRKTLDFWASLDPIDRICAPEHVARAEEIVAAVEAYRIEDRKAMEACGCGELDRAFDVEAAVVEAIVARMVGIPARTADGICAKARAASIADPDEPDAARLSASLIADARKLGATPSRAPVAA